MVEYCPQYTSYVGGTGRQGLPPDNTVAQRLSRLVCDILWTIYSTDNNSKSGFKENITEKCRYLLVAIRFYVIRLITHGSYNICSAWFLDIRITTC